MIKRVSTNSKPPLTGTKSHGGMYEQKGSSLRNEAAKLQQKMLSSFTNSNPTIATNAVTTNSSNSSSAIIKTSNMATVGSRIKHQRSHSAVCEIKDDHTFFGNSRPHLDRKQVTTDIYISIFINIIFINTNYVNDLYSMI